MKPYNIIVILGPTASGKTKLAANVAAITNSEIISADSRQVYRNMNIGTGKDLEEYQVVGKIIPYHLIDIRSAGDDYNLNEYINDFNIAFEKITNENKIPILCGGTGLYIDALLKGYQYTGIPVNKKLRNELKDKSLEELLQLFSQHETPYHKVADTSTHKRMIRAIEIASWLIENKNHQTNSLPKLEPIIFGLSTERETRRLRIEKRLQQRLQNGLIEEVESLLTEGVSKEKLIFYGLEYKFIVQYLQKEISYDYLIEHLTIAIQQFAKRQMTYFRKMEREGLLINWIDAELSLNEQVEMVKSEL